MIGVEWSGYMSDGELERAAAAERYARHLNGVGAWEMVCDGLPDGEIIAFLLELRGFTRVVLP